MPAISVEIGVRRIGHVTPERLGIAGPRGLEQRIGVTGIGRREADRAADERSGHGPVRCRRRAHGVASIAATTARIVPRIAAAASPP